MTIIHVAAFSTRSSGLMPYATVPLAFFKGLPTFESLEHILPPLKNSFPSPWAQIPATPSINPQLPGHLLKEAVPLHPFQ